jgi:hypothetical protein
MELMKENHKTVRGLAHEAGFSPTFSHGQYGYGQSFFVIFFQACDNIPTVKRSVMA